MVFIRNSDFPSLFFRLILRKLEDFRCDWERQTVNVFYGYRRQAECAKTARIQMALPPGGKAPAAAAPAANLYEELGDGSM